MKLTDLFESDKETRRLQRSYQSTGDVEDLEEYFKAKLRSGGFQTSEFQSDPITSKAQKLKNMPDRWQRRPRDAAQPFRNYWSELYYGAGRDFMQYEIPRIGLITLYVNGDVYRTIDDDGNNAEFGDHVPIGQLSPESTRFFEDWPEEAGYSDEDAANELRFWTEFTNLVRENIVT